MASPPSGLFRRAAGIQRVCWDQGLALVHGHPPSLKSFKYSLELNVLALSSVFNPVCSQGGGWS